MIQIIKPTPKLALLYRLMTQKCKAYMYVSYLPVLQQFVYIQEETTFYILITTINSIF